MPTAGTPRLTRSARVAWTGAAVFLFSLLWSIYEYLIGFDTRTANHTPAVAVTFDVLLFSLFALHHSLLARSGAKRLVVRWVPAELERSLYTWAASLLFILVCSVLAGGSRDAVRAARFLARARVRRAARRPRPDDPKLRRAGRSRSGWRAAGAARQPGNTTASRRRSRPPDSTASSGIPSTSPGP